jgi:hypothetical protein
MTRSFVITVPFERHWKSMGLADEELRQLEIEILRDPKQNPVIPNTGRLRKMRFAFEGRGKSGSVRVLYVDFEDIKQIYLIGAFSKSEKENLTRAEQILMKKIVDAIEQTLM